jgi:hypothetical protein
MHHDEDSGAGQVRMIIRPGRLITGPGGPGQISPGTKNMCAGHGCRSSSSPAERFQVYNNKKWNLLS